ncbi:MAG: ferrochelatase [Aquimonas sp.]|nr:ferrochelatase [Aquimonas sp.]
MTYLGRPDYRHGSTERAAVLLVNLGTPDAPTPGAVRRYLREFLSDPRVIELPRLLWLPLLYGVILPLRSRRSAKAYHEVWTEQGSPLMVHTRNLAEGLQRALATDERPLTVRMAMRYGNPSIASVLDELRAEGVRRLLVLPMYPQFSATTTASVFDAVVDALKRWRWTPELRFITDYHREPAWLDAVANSVRAHWNTHGRGERLLFSFHGIPKRYFRSGDPYHCLCHHGAREVASRLGLGPQEWTLSFQSRVGREEWLKPYTDETVRTLAKEGVRRLDVVCPGFAVDCLETVEEIAGENAEYFREAGGETLSYIPALNDSPAHVQALLPLLLRHGSGWAEFDPAPWPVAAQQAEEAERAARFERFQAPE